MNSKVSVEMQTSSELRSYSDQFGSMMAELQNENNSLQLRLNHLQSSMSDQKASNADRLKNKVNELDAFKEQIEFYKQELANWDTVHRSKLESEIQAYRSLLNTQLRTMKTDSYMIVKPASQTIVKTIVRERSPTPPPPVQQQISYTTG